jgi:hypothetical protein
VLKRRANEIGSDPDLDQAIISRIGEITVGDLACVTVYADERREGDTATHSVNYDPLQVVRSAMARIAATPETAISVVNIAEQRYGVITKCRVDPHGCEFIARQTIEHRETVVEAQAIRRSSTGARSAAATAALGRYTGVIHDTSVQEDGETEGKRIDYVLCFSDRGLETGPHPVSQEELRAAFNAGSGWNVVAIEPDRVQTRYHDNGAPAWFSTIKRL